MSDAANEHPAWADPPYPDRPPTRLARLFIRWTTALRKRNIPPASTGGEDQ